MADNKTGYFGVQIARPGQPKPYQARVRRGGKYVYLGCFVTAEEAALCVARSPKGQAVAAERAAAAATLTNQPRSSGYRRTTCCVSPQLLCFTTIAVFLSVYDGYTLSLGTGHSTLVPGYTLYHIYVLVPDILSSGCSIVSVTCLS